MLQRVLTIYSVHMCSSPHIPQTLEPPTALQRTNQQTSKVVQTAPAHGISARQKVEQALVMQERPVSIDTSEAKQFTSYSQSPPQSSSTSDSPPSAAAASSSLISRSSSSSSTMPGFSTAAAPAAPAAAVASLIAGTTGAAVFLSAAGLPAAGLAAGASSLLEGDSPEPSAVSSSDVSAGTHAFSQLYAPCSS